jgi:hypothetical protein
MNATSQMYGTRKGGALVNNRNEYLPEGFFFTSTKREPTDPEQVIAPPQDGPGFTRIGLELDARKMRTRARLASKSDTKAKILARKNAFRARKGLPPLPTK